MFIDDIIFDFPLNIFHWTKAWPEDVRQAEMASGKTTHLPKAGVSPLNPALSYRPLGGMDKT